MSGTIKTDVTPKAVLHIKDVQDPQAGSNTRQIALNAEAIPGRGQDAFLLMLAHQVLDATKIDTSTAEEAETRYNATMAALQRLRQSEHLRGCLRLS